MSILPLFVAVLPPLIIGSLLLALIGVAVLQLFGSGDREHTITEIVKFGLSGSCLSAIGSGAILLAGPDLTLPVLDLALRPAPGQTFEFKLALDHLAIPFVLVTSLLCGTVGAFSRSYLHKDPGHGRFFFLLLLFTLGMEVIFMAASFEVLFVGWELIGLTSALLISFFFERRSTADNSLKAFLAYRVSDTALLTCSLLFALGGAEGVLISSHEKGLLPEGMLSIVIPALVILAALPKSAQFPFSAWLPRAMEGPTPSSAIFYGGLSVHAGFYLILRFQHQFVVPAFFYVVLVVIGILSALYGNLLAKVQTDVKSMLAYGAITHVGLMFIEVGFGFERLAIMHFVGHAFLRSYQILSAGSLVHESRSLGVAKRSSIFDRLKRPALFEWFHAVALDLSLRDGSQPTSMVNRLERLSSRIAAFEEWYTKGVVGGLSTATERESRVVDSASHASSALAKEQVKS